MVVKPNEHQIDDVKRLTKELGVDELKLKTAQIYDYKNGSDLIQIIQHIHATKGIEMGRIQ